MASFHSLDDTSFDFQTLETFQGDEGDPFSNDDIAMLCEMLVPESNTQESLVFDFPPSPPSSHEDKSHTNEDPKRVCAITECHKRVRSRGLCKAHGGGRRCSVAGCIKSSQGQGLCIRHGGGRRCQVTGCSRGAQSNGKCKNHGGGIRCRHHGCTKSSQGAGFCRTHGGGKLCKHPGCKKGSQRKGYCATHSHSLFTMTTSQTEIIL